MIGYQHCRLVVFCFIGALCFSGSGAAQEFVRPKIVETNLYKRSDVLFDRGRHTVIPKKAALYVPPTLKERLMDGPKGKFQPWPSFYRANYSWITVLEVTLEQAKGEEPIDEERLKVMGRLGKIIVAVHQKSPISVKEYVEKKTQNKSE